MRVRSPATPVRTGSMLRVASPHREPNSLQSRPPWRPAGRLLRSGSSTEMMRGLCCHRRSGSIPASVRASPSATRLASQHAQHTAPSTLHVQCSGILSGELVFEADFPRNATLDDIHKRCCAELVCPNVSFKHEGADLGLDAHLENFTELILKEGVGGFQCSKCSDMIRGSVYRQCGQLLHYGCVDHTEPTNEFQQVWSPA